MHPNVLQTKPGRCPECGMKLVEQGSAHEVSHNHHHEETSSESYRPLFIILSLISLVTVVFAVQSFLVGTLNWNIVMANFMAGFFLVFSGFKLLDLNGFAEGYSTYDLLAKRVFAYGLMYPFLELGLGLMYALHIDHPFLHLFTVLLLTFSGIGVAVKLARKEPFQCACLGTFLKVPLTKVTLIEDFGMAIMAGLMLL